MTEQAHRRQQSRMVPALVAALVGALLGALVVLTGVLAGQRGGCCCCNGYGSVCGESGAGTAVPFDLTPGRPYLLPPVIVPPWVRPELQRHEVPAPGTLMLVGMGAVLLGRMS